MSVWHTSSLAEIERELNSNFQNGLGEAEAKKRFVSDGPNELPAEETEGIVRIFIRQFKSPLIYILLGASVLVFFLREPSDSVLILITLLFNAVVGTFQEGKAENTLKALRSFSKATATVLRDGRENIIQDREVVHGDVIIVREGEKIPADARLIETHTLRIDEAALTGESVPVHKQENAVSEDGASLSHRTNMLYKGTNALGGSGKAIVVGTGINTEIGKISRSIANIRGEIPLQKNIAELSRLIIYVVNVIIFVIFGVGLYMGHSAIELFTVVISLAISIVPEGLPIVLTLILATGVWRMARKNALVKKLQAVEALGEAKVIAVDKTGTLTKNEMVVREIFVNNETFNVSGDGYEPKGQMSQGGHAIDPPNHPELVLAAKIGALCGTARVTFWEDQKVWKVSGDPTEAAMLVFAEKLGFRKEDIEEEMRLIGEEPFDYRTKYHVTAHAGVKKQFLSITGAPEVLIGLASHYLENGKVKPITLKKKDSLEHALRQMSHQGLRVVAFGYRETPLSSEREVLDVNGLIFVGFWGIEDSLRLEVPEAMARAQSAGVRVVMITGDSRVTAIAIAKQAGIFHEGDTVITDKELETLSPLELDRALETTTVFARVTPEHKMRIVQAYKRRGEIVAMTGDGVNDAPSLVAADLGVAMGKIGTDVAKEAADIILLDDNFGSVVSAIEEGRAMYRTIQKAILFLFSTSAGEVIAIGGAIMIGLPTPLLAAQILWLNLVTDSMVALALAFDQKEDGILLKKFKPTKSFVDTLMIHRMIVMAVPIGVGSLALFLAYYDDLLKAYSMTLTALAMFQWLNGWNCRSETDSVFATNPLANGYLVVGVGGAIAMHIFALYSPFMQKLLSIAPLTMADWLTVCAVTSSIVLAEEVRKFLMRRRIRREAV